MAGHHHHHVGADAGDRRIWIAIAVNIALTVVQIVGGLFAGSLALIADALHNLSDGLALVIAFVARRVGRRGADAAMPFGYARAEIAAALINYTALIMLGLYLTGEAFTRLFNPEPVEGWTVVVIAGVALAVDAVTAALVYTMSKTSVNIRAAFLHNMVDAASSLAVMVAGALIIVFGWQIADPLITLLISASILWVAGREIGGVIRLVMLGTPDGLKTADVIAALKTVDGVGDVHHARLWAVSETETAFDAHVVIDPGAWGDADAIKAAIKAKLADEFHVTSSTLELECAAHACVDAPEIGTGTGSAEPAHSHSH